jgi:chromosome segregation ATPase
MCECYKIGGPFIDVDPDCPIHNKNHRDYQEDQSDVIEQLQAKVAELEEENARLKVDRAKKQKESVTIFDVNCELRARVRELEEENARLKAESRDACLGLNDYYGRKLAAEQLNNKRLRQDQELLVEAWNYGQFADDFNQPQASSVRAAIRRFCEALSTPISTEAISTIKEGEGK